MGKRGRLSAEALLLPRVDGSQRRVRPPAGLDRDVTALFRQLVGGCDPQHFMESDSPLLIEYCRAVLLAERAHRELQRKGPVLNSKPSPWILVQEKSVRSMVALSLRLRVSPQARLRPETTARRALGPKPSVYEMLGQDDE